MEGRTSRRAVGAAALAAVALGVALVIARNARDGAGRRTPASGAPAGARVDAPPTGRVLAPLASTAPERERVLASEPVEAPADARVVTGVVSERSGAPVAAATCTLSPGLPASLFAVPDDESARVALSEARSDAAGEFELAARDGPLRLDVRRAGFAPWSRDHLVAGDVVEVRLDPEVLLRLAVRAPDGAPVADAEVTVAAAGEDSEPPRARVRTDAAGRAAAGGLAPGAWRVVVRRSGFGVRDDRLEIPAGVFVLEHEIELERGTRLAGTVRSRAGAPIAGARVRIESPNRHAALVEELSTDASGRYESEPLFTVSETLEVTAAAEGFAEAWVFFAVKPEQAGAESVTLDLELDGSARTVAGRAVDGGAGVAAASVRIATLDPIARSPEGVLDAIRSLPPRAWMWQEVARTDGDGRFELRGLSPVPQYVLLLVRDDYAPRAVWVPPPDDSGDAGARTELGELELERPGSLFGRARYEDGAPAEGVELALFELNRVTVASQADLAGWRPSSWTGAILLRTREGGAFRADHLDPGEYGFIESQESWQVEAGRATGPLELVLRRPEGESASLAGIVRGGDGAALPSAFVRAIAGGDGEARLAATDLADARGRFELELRAAGALRLVVTDLGGTHHERELVVEPPFAEALEIVLDARAAPLPPVEGSVHSARGAPLEGCGITLRPPEDALCACIAFHARTDAAGAFRLRASEGPHRLTASHPEYLPGELFPVRPGEHVWIELSEP